MTVFAKELRQSVKAWCIWTGAISFLLFICIIMFPEMKNEMDEVSSVFANMGGFTAAFGMDRLSFGELMGFYGIECGNILGIGGGFFAALCGISALSGEEKEHTAEFLLTHPISRVSVLTQKLLSVLARVIVMNIVIVAVSLLSASVVGETFDMQKLVLLHAAYLVMQIEISCVCFGISAFIRRGSIGIGLGLPLALYFMNIIRNISEQASFLKYITPYAYCDASEIISTSQADAGLLALGAGTAAVAAAAGYLKYMSKDIFS